MVTPRRTVVEPGSAVVEPVETTAAFVVSEKSIALHKKLVLAQSPLF